ncbi:PREDICTED: early nodulin-like protein 2 isoform X2 [Ipomoea nil]|uniref:early nodulin-like protein 2 isoform X2 n=1 Tax=Ipomoea nil TaxID=35883 RepID=UPI00090169DA|nr:PREDICTED: early nodulin-like protein 2 isoform X2 [Ipomoea nil]
MEMAHNMRGVVAVAVAVVVLVVAVGGGGGGVTAQVLHVVGGDRGWEPSNIIHDWCSGRVFRVGDTVCFAYSIGQDSIVELGSLEEYESCDLSNPIRMFTDGLDKISLDGEGIRYFASGNIDNCRKGLKLPVNVQPQVYGPTSAESPIVYGPSMETDQAQSPAMGHGYGHTSYLSSAESPVGYWPSMETDQAQSPSMGREYGPTSSLTSAESPLISGSEGPTPSLPFTFHQFWKTKQIKNSLMDGADGPTSSSAMNSHNGLRIIGQKKWAKGLSEKATDGPKSLSAPISLNGPFGLWAVGLLLHVINYY